MQGWGMGLWEKLLKGNQRGIFCFPLRVILLSQEDHMLSRQKLLPIPHSWVGGAEG